MDVARKAGVSPSTVSRILNGTAKVSDDKRQAVLAAIEQMNFAPNQMAQGLKRGRSMTIGIVVQDISSPFFDETLRGVVEQSRRRSAVYDALVNPTPVVIDVITG